MVDLLDFYESLKQRIEKLEVRIKELEIENENLRAKRLYARSKSYGKIGISCKNIYYA